MERSDRHVSMDTLRSLFAEGMTGVRLNLSHTSLADAADWIANIQQAYETVVGGQSTADATSVPELLMDLQGPELRIGTMRGVQELSEGGGGRAGDGRKGVGRSRETIPVPAVILPHLKREAGGSAGRRTHPACGETVPSDGTWMCGRVHGNVSNTARRSAAQQKEYCVAGTSWK